MDNMSEKNQSNKLSKHNYRQKIWKYMMDNDLVNFPSSLYNRIPNFKGADEAARRLSQLEEFKKAQVIKINPDKPQEPVRMLALESGKEILVPIPRLKSGLFLHVKPPVDLSKESIKALITRDGMQQHGQSLGIDADVKVDLVILGAVCVSRNGYRIGKGEGFADLEFAMMMRMGAICDKTIVVTTVHDCQILDDLEVDLFEKHDVPVDIIVTPTQTIFVNERLKKPEGIYWDILTQRRVNSMPILKQLKKIDESDGEEIVLKKYIPNEEQKTRRLENNWGRRGRLRNIYKPKRNSESKGDKEIENELKNKEEIKIRAPRRRQPRKQNKKIENSENSAHSSSIIEEKEKIIDKTREKPSRRKPFRPKSKSDIDFSLKLSNIAPNIHVRDLKIALSERGVRPTDITWRGKRGFCFLHFGKLRNKDSEPNEPVQVDSIVANLQQLRLGDVNSTSNENIDDFIVVEPAKPITRIEITDVTTV